MAATNIGVSGVSFAAMNPDRSVGIVIASEDTLELIPSISPWISVPADLLMRDDMLACDSPFDIEYIGASRSNCHGEVTSKFIAINVGRVIIVTIIIWYSLNFFTTSLRTTACAIIAQSPTYAK